MPRKLLVFAVLAVAGSMLALWLATRDRGGESSAQPPTEQVAETRETRERTRPTLEGDTTAAGGSAEQHEFPAGDRAHAPKNGDPTRPQGTVIESVERGTTEKPVKPPPLEYTLPDGRRVRDFRSPEKRVPLEVPPSVHPPGGRRIKPEVTGLYSEQVIKYMKECGKAVPKDALGTKPRLEGQIVIAIKNGEGSITSAVFKLVDVTNAQLAQSTQQCVEQKALTVKVAAPDEADLDSYSINLSFAFP